MYKSKRILSFILAITMILGGIPTSVFANTSSNINLSFEDVNMNQNVFSKSYLVQGELKTLYAYNTKEGTCRITGDIPYSGGTYNSFSIRHEEGYLEFPFTLQNLSVGCLTDDSVEGCYLLFLTTDNELRSFTYTSDGWSEDFQSRWSFRNEQYEATLIESNVVKLEKNVFVTEDGNAYALSGGCKTKLGSYVKDIVFISNNILRVTCTDGSVDYHNLEDLFEFYLLNPSSPFEDKFYSISEEIDDGYKSNIFDTRSNFLVYKYIDSALKVIPSENLLTIEHLKATSSEMDMLLSVDNYTSFSPNHYTYNLFNDNVVLEIFTEDITDVVVIDYMLISTSDNSKPELMSDGIKTNFGNIVFQCSESDYSYNNISIDFSDGNYKFLEGFKDVIEKPYTSRGAGTFKDLTQYDLYIDEHALQDSWCIDGSIYAVSLSFNDTIIDVKIDYSNRYAVITSRESGVSYDISSSFDFDNVCNGLVYIIVDNFNLSDGFYYYCESAVPSLYYDSVTDRIIVSYYTYSTDAFATLKFIYERSKSLQALKEAGASDEELLFLAYDLYVHICSSIGAYGSTKSDLDTIDYIVNDFFELDVDTSEWLFFTDKVPLITTAGREALMYYIYLVYTYGNDMDAIKADPAYSAFRLRFDENGEYIKINSNGEPYSNQYYRLIRSEFAKQIVCDYLTVANPNLCVTSFTTNYKFGERYQYDALEQYMYSVSVGAYRGRRSTGVSVLINEDAVLLSTVAPYMFSNTSTNGNNAMNEYYYGLDTKGNYYTLKFDNNLSSVNLSTEFGVDPSYIIPVRCTQEKVASDVVKINTLGYYLTSAGNLYTDEGVLFKSGVTNLSDNLYELQGKWYYLDSSKEFIFDYASDLNLRPVVLADTDDIIIYEFIYNSDIAYVTAPNGSILNSGDNYTINQNGCYIFEVTNKYGDTFEELILVKHLGISGTSGLIPTVVDKILTIQAPHTAVLEYSLDNATWEVFEDSFDMSDSNYVYIRGTDGDTFLGTNLLSLSDSGKLDVYNITPADFNSDNFLGLGYIKDGGLYNQYNQLIKGEVTDAVFKDDENIIYTDNNGELNIYKEYDNEISFFPIYRSDKIDFESNLEHVVDMATDGYYAYLLGDSGNLVSVSFGNDTFKIEDSGTYITTIIRNWTQDWLGEKFTDIKHGVAYKTDGSSLNLYDIDMSDIDFSSLDYVKEYDVNGNPIFEQNIVVRSTEYIDDCYYILTANLDVYEYFEGDDYASYLYTIDLDANTIDFTVDDTNWVQNSGYTVSFDIPDDLPSLYVRPSSSYTGTYDFVTILNDIIKTGDVSFDINSLNSESSYVINTGDSPLQITTIQQGYRHNLYSYNCAVRYYNITDGGDAQVNPDCTYIDLSGNVTNFGTSSTSYDYKDGVFVDTVTLEPNSKYRIQVQIDKSFISNHTGDMFIINNTFTGLDDYIDVGSRIEVLDRNGYHQEVTCIDDDTYSFTPEKVGVYSALIRNTAGGVVTRGAIRVANFDPYKPELQKLQFNLDGSITPIFKDYIDSSGDTATSGVWTLEYSIDDGATWNELTGNLVYSPTSTYNLRNVVLTQPNVQLRATDKAGNVSDVYAVNLDMQIFESYIYENGKTSVKFYADDDSDWTNPDYAYSYTIDSMLSEGYEFSVLEDTEVILRADKEDTIPISTVKPIEVEVVTADKPSISSTGNELLVSATDKYENADFSKLFVNIDRTGYQEYTLEELTKVLGAGTHIIDAYYEVVKDGQIVKSLEETAIITVAELNETEIHTSVEYENGKTTLEFYANEDTTNTEFTYSYIIGGVETSGHTVEVTEDTIVELVAKKSGYEDGNKTVNLIVISTEKPNISDLVNNKYVTVSKGDIENASLDKITITLDGVVSETTSPSEILELLTEGSHNIKATQTVKAIIDGETITITSDEAEADVTVKGTIVLHPSYTYENGKTVVTFYADDDTNHDSGYTYTYEIGGVSAEGHTFDVTESGIVTIKAERSDKMPSEQELDVTVIKVAPPNITKLNDSVAVVTVGNIQNTNFDKLYIQYNNGNVVEFTDIMADVPLAVGENIIKAYVTTKTEIDGQLVEITSDINEKTFNIADNSKVYYTVTVKDHFGSNVNTRLEQLFEANTSYSFNALTVGGWNVTGDTVKTGTVNGNIVLDFYYEQIQVPTDTYYLLTVRDHFGSDIVTRSVQSLKEGTEYKVTALGLNDWNVTGQSNVVGVLNSDTVVDFYYIADTPSYDDNSDYVTIKVVDHLGSTEIVRELVSVLKNTTYEYAPIAYNGYRPVVNTGVSGTALENIVIDFHYVADNSADTDLVSLKVVDHFGTNTEVRYNKNVEAGFYYNIGSVDRAGWLLTSASNFSGILLSDNELHFYYSRIPADAVTYTLTVKDHFGTDVNTRFVETLIAGDSYNVNALTVGKWLVQGVANYSGNISSDLVIDFYYEQEQEPVIEYYTLTVKDTFGTNTSVRYVQTLAENSSYVVSALNVGGWTPTGVATHSGLITQDMVLEFHYVEESDPVTNYYTLTVKDTFGDTTNIRYTQTLAENSSYVVNALNVGGWILQGTSNYSGVITDNLVIEFTYAEEQEPVITYYTLTVKDVFGDDTNIRFTQSLAEGSNYSVSALVLDNWAVRGTSVYSGTLTQDLVLEFVYDSTVVTPTYYNLTVKDTFNGVTSTRFTQKLEANSSYSVNALNIEGWLATGVSSYSGNITQDLVIEFTYVKETVPEPTYYTLTVKDTFGTDTNIRFVQSLVEGSNYTVNAMVVDGWKVTGVSTYTGTLTDDLVIEFVYEKDLPPVTNYYNLVVKDTFGDKTTTRYTQSLAEGTSFVANALEIDGWKVVGVSSISEVITKDTVIEFVYESTVVEPTYYTLTVKDTFGDNTTIRYTKDLLANSNYSIEALNIEGWVIDGKSVYEGVIVKDIIIEFKYSKEVVDEPTYYTLTVYDKFRTEECRFSIKVLAGYEYSIGYITRDGWVADGNGKLSGVVKEDTVLVFKYIEITPPPIDDPIPPTPDDDDDDDDPIPPPKEDDEPVIPGPQTGDNTNLALLLWLMLASGISIILLSIKRKK